MGEGWGDFVATLLRQRAEYTREDAFTMGEYSYGQNIRRFPYSTDMTVDPETYGYIRKWQYWGVHAKGEVWAGILLEAYWNLVDAHGFDPDWYSGTGGNNIMLRNVIDGMKLQPCRPTFVDARNAILQADRINYGGKNACLLWKGFAKRGLGTKAMANGREDFSLPRKCRK